MFHVVSIEGNIASGKSTLLETLKQSADRSQVALCFISEPLQALQKNGWLQKFYRDMHRHAFSFQFIMLMKKWKSMLEQILKLCSTPQQRPVVIITERSLYSDSRVFTAALHSMGHIDNTDMELIQEAYETYLCTLRLLHCKEIGYVYLNTDAGECYKRYISRDREGETLEPKYLNILQNVHTAMLSARCLPYVTVSETSGTKVADSILGWICQLSQDQTSQPHVTLN